MQKAAVCTGAVSAALWLAGCATPGPVHLYVASAERPQVIMDIAPTQPAGSAVARVDVPSHLRLGEGLLGMAYDPFTDHLFLRLPPGNRFRVVDRPAKKIKREFTAEGVSIPGGGDLAVRSRDRHLFLSHPREAAVIEVTLYGNYVRTIPLQGLQAPPAGVAYDQQREELLVLSGGDLVYVTRFDREGSRLGAVVLDRDVELTALGFDSAERMFYAPLRGGRAVGVFNEQGQWKREVPVSEAALAMIRGLDVGPRSLVRLF